MTKYQEEKDVRMSEWRKKRGRTEGEGRNGGRKESRKQGGREGNSQLEQNYYFSVYVLIWNF